MTPLRRLAAILSLDVEGFYGLVEADETAALASVERAYKRFVRPTVVVSEKPDDEMFATEYFGPILAVHVYDDSQDGAFESVVAQMESFAPYALTGAIIISLGNEHAGLFSNDDALAKDLADAGNAWEEIPDLSPLDLKRSLGFGFRVQTPMLGMIGFDFGYGFDRPKVDGVPAGWNTHFQFGPQFF